MISGYDERSLIIYKKNKCDYVNIVENYDKEKYKCICKIKE